MHACVHVCVRACMRACMRACVRVCVCDGWAATQYNLYHLNIGVLHGDNNINIIIVTSPRILITLLWSM